MLQIGRTMPVMELFGRSILLLTLMTVLLCIAVVDSRQAIIPDWCNLIILFAGFAGTAAGYGPSPAEAIFAVLIAFSVVLLLRHAFFLWRGQAGLGLGDVKFLAAAATWTGFAGMPTLVLIASLSGILYLGARLLLGLLVTSDMRIPFGPHLAAGLAYVSIFGPFG
jgi:leader peptidase (prepilin peptidase) / N-methyltransferase